MAETGKNVTCKYRGTLTEQTDYQRIAQEYIFLSSLNFIITKKPEQQMLSRDYSMFILIFYVSD